MTYLVNDITQFHFNTAIITHHFNTCLGKNSSQEKGNAYFPVYYILQAVGQNVLISMESNKHSLLDTWNEKNKLGRSINLYLYPCRTHLSSSVKEPNLILPRVKWSEYKLYLCHWKMILTFFSLSICLSTEPRPLLTYPYSFFILLHTFSLCSRHIS